MAESPHDETTRAAAMKRDAKMLLLIAAGFLAASFVLEFLAVSLRMPDDYVTTLTAMRAMFLCAAAVIGLWAVTRSLSPAARRFAARWLRFSWGRAVCHAVLAAAAAAATHCYFLEHPPEERLDASVTGFGMTRPCWQPEGGPFVYYPIRDGPDALAWFVTQLPAGAYGVVKVANWTPDVEPDDFNGNADGIIRALCLTDTWYGMRRLEQAVARAEQAAAAAGWPAANIRERIEACRNTPAALAQRQPPTLAEVRRAAESFPLLHWRIVEDQYQPGTFTLYLDTTREPLISPQFFFVPSSAPGWRFHMRGEGRKLSLCSEYHNQTTVVLLDMDARTIVMAMFPGEFSGMIARGIPERRFYRSLPACLAAIFLAWAVLLAPFCYLTRRTDNAER